MSTNTTFSHILSFMQSQDKNGTWYDSDITEVPYILSTLNEWLEDGLTLTPRIKSYITYLQSL